jgi:hypothetical protein
MAYLLVKKDVSRFTKEPIIYFNPANKKIFFYQPHGFEKGDYIRIYIDRQKRIIRFVRYSDPTSDAYKFTEFDKKKGTIECPILFSEFPNIFQISNKYESHIASVSSDLTEYILLIHLQFPIPMKRRPKKELLEIEQLALALADKEEK